MNKHDNHMPRGVTLFLALLCCLAVQAQPGLEYWFDGNYGDKVNINAPSAAGTFKNNINVKQLSQGFHTIYIRARGLSQDDHSPITSAAFFKYDASSDNVLEYWFDEGEKRRLSTPINVETEDVQALSLDLSDIDRFPLGVHRLNIRVSAHGGNYSPVYTTYVLRMPEGSGEAVLEYWFDDDLDKRSSKPISLESDKPQLFDLDLTGFPIGFHKLSMRIAAGVSHSSQVYTSHILRLPIEQQSGRIYYWLDDDYANRKWVESSRISTKTSDYFIDLNFSSASIGMHRLRFQASRGGLNGPIEEAAVLFTKKYNSRGSVHLTNQSIWLDDNDPSVSALNSVENIIVKNYYLNPNDYADGQHAFHMMYQNSADVWSEQNVTYFYKEPSTGILRIGIMPEDVDGINDTEQQAYFSCKHINGVLYIDCESAQLAQTGIITVYDLQGRILARQTVTNNQGIHTQLTLESNPGQLLIVRLTSGGVIHTKKLK